MEKRKNTDDTEKKKDGQSAEQVRQIRRVTAQDINADWAKGNALYTKWASIHRIGYPELMVLYVLDWRGAQTQKDISHSVGMTKQTVNTVISKLKQKGYVRLETAQTDRREKMACLTATGRKYADGILEPLREIEDQIYEKIEQERLLQMLETSGEINRLMEQEINREEQEMKREKAEKKREEQKK